MRHTMNLLLMVPMIILLDQYQALPMKTIMTQGRKIYVLAVPDNGQAINNVVRYQNAMLDQQSDEDNRSEALQKRVYVNPMCPNVDTVHQGNQVIAASSSEVPVNEPAYVKPDKMSEKDEEAPDEKGAYSSVTQLPVIYSMGGSYDANPILVSESEILGGTDQAKNEPKIVAPAENKCACQNNDVPVSAGQPVQPVYVKMAAVSAENEMPNNNDVIARNFAHIRRGYSAYRYGGIGR